MSTFHCPICDREFTPGDSMPFCSTRCKLIDCGRWLGEKYGLPIEEESAESPTDDEATKHPIS